MTTQAQGSRTNLDYVAGLYLTAGNDVVLAAGRNEQSVDIASYASGKSGGGLTKKTVTRSLEIKAATATAQDTLALNAGRNLTVGAAESASTDYQRLQMATKEDHLLGRQSLKTTRDETTVTPEVAQLSAKTITLQAGQDMTLVAPKIQADTLRGTAGGQLTVAAATATHELKETSEFKTNRMNFSEAMAPIRGGNLVKNIFAPTGESMVTGGRIKDKIKLTESGSERLAVVAAIEAQRIALSSGNDTTLVAPRIRAETLRIEAGKVDGETTNPNATIQLLGVKESQTTTSGKNSHSRLHETVRDGGSSEETLLLPDIRLPGEAEAAGTTTQLALSAPGGLVVGATSLAPTQKEQAQAGSGSSGGNPPSGTPLDLKAQAATLAKQPGMAWLGEVAKRDDVDWQKIELATQNWDYKRAGLTQEGAIVVAIVVTILTWGTAAEAGAAIIEGAGASAAAGSAGAAMAAGIAAGLTTLASQAAVSLINNQGDVGKTLQDLGSKDSIKQIVASMLTAGLAQGATQALQGAGIIGKVTADAGFATRFANYATKAVVAAGVQSAVFGTPLSETAKTALINSLAQTLTSEIGDWGKSDSAMVAKTIAHAVVQCAAASVQNKDCGSAALGAAVAEALSPVLDKLDASTRAAGYQQTLGSSIAGMSAMLVASLTGQDALTAMNSAQMVDNFNRQLHIDQGELERAKQLAAKSNGKYTEQQVADALRWADNSKLGETAQSNMTIDKTSDAALGSKPNDPIAGTVFDPMIPGQTTTASQPYVSDGSGILVQNMSQVAKPSADLMAYIQQNTGGASSPYSWNTAAWQASPEPNVDNTRYATVSADGKTFSVPLADCPAAGCANGGSIAWATTNEADRKVLADYQDALNKQVSKAAVTAGVAGATVFAPGTLLGVAGAGVLAGGTISGANQYIDTGNIDLRKTSFDAGWSGLFGLGAYGVATVGGNVFSAIAGKAASTESLSASEVVALKQVETTNAFYRDGGIADPSKPMSFVGPWSSTAELTSVQANAQVVSKLPPGSTITGRINADLENAKAIADGWQAPFVPGTQVLEITTSQATQYVRVFGGDSRQVGSWVMRAEDVQGLTPEQIASKFSLPQVPNMIGDVTIPAGTRLNVSAANGISPNASKGVYTGDNVGGGGVQFQIIGRPMDPMEFSSWFSNPRGLK